MWPGLSLFFERVGRHERERGLPVQPASKALATCSTSIRGSGDKAPFACRMPRTTLAVILVAASPMSIGPQARSYLP